jgi:hypothetical protein
MFEARPVYTVFAVDRFEVAAANEISRDELARARPEFAALPLTGPRVVAAAIPTNGNDQLTIAMRTMTGGGELKSLPEYYVNYDAEAARVAARAKPLKELEKRNAELPAVVLERLEKAPDDLGFVPVVGRFRSMTAIVDKRSGAIESIVDVDPW